MANSDFPVIKFSTRQQDNGRTPGGGGGDSKVSWLLTGSELQKHSQYLVSELEELKDNWDSNNIKGLPHVLKVDVIENALAKTYRRGIVPMFKVGDNTGQIGFVGETSLILKVDSKEKLKAIQKNFADTDKNAAQISALAAIQFFSPTVKPEIEGLAYKLSPLDFSDETQNKRAVKVIDDALKSKKMDHELVYYTKNLPVFKLDNVTSDSSEFIRTLPIRAAEPMEEVTNPFRLLDDSPIDHSERLVLFDTSASYPVVGLLDSGVNINSLTRQWVTRGKGCQYSDDELNLAHGTYIATLLIHGDSISGTNDSSIRGCKIIDVPVVPAKGIDGVSLVNNIRIAVEQNPEVRIWSLSVSLDGEINSDEFSDFAIALEYRYL